MVKKTIIAVAIILLTTIVAKSANISSAYFKNEIITYTSVDAMNRPVTLSAMVYYPTNITKSRYKTVKFIVLDCHPTITDDASSPTGNSPAVGEVKYMTSEDALVICPDYQGFGKSVNQIHPYMCPLLNARNVVDCFMAVMKDAKNNKGINFDSNYNTISIGYSQGGQVSLSVQKYIETEASEEERNEMRLSKTITGAGPYFIKQICDEYEKLESINYPLLIPYIMLGIKETYSGNTLRTLNINECFTEKFLETGILDIISNKSKSVDEINDMIIKAFGGKCSFYDIVNADYADHNSKLYRLIQKALTQCNYFDDWQPSHPIVFFHYTEDEVVDYNLTTKVMMEQLSKSDVKFVDAKNDFSLSKNPTWEIGLIGKTEWNHRNVGTRFYLMFFSGNLR